MSEALDALGRSLHHAGVNLDRTTLGVAVRNLEQRGYRIAPASTPQFHVHPAADTNTALGKHVEGVAGSTKRGAGRV